MDKVRVRKIAPGERRWLKRVKRQRANGVNQTHARIILLSAGGVCNREIARLVECTARWVREIIHRFNRGGLQAVEWYPWMQGCWAKAGCKRVDRLRATYHRHGGVRHFLAAFDLETGRLFGQFQPRKTWREFLAFLKWLRRRYRRDEVLHVVLDNYRPQLSAEVLKWAKAHRMKLYFTPTNASWLNRIECQFTALRKFALDNTDFHSHEQQQAAIESYLAWCNGKREIAVESWRTYKQHLTKTDQSHYNVAA